MIDDDVGGSGGDAEDRGGIDGGMRVCLSEFDAPLVFLFAFALSNSKGDERAGVFNVRMTSSSSSERSWRLAWLLTM